MKTIRVKLKDNPYNVYIGHNLIRNIPSCLRKLNLGNLGIIITSPKVHCLYKKIIENNFPSDRYRLITVIDGERAKSLKFTLKIIEKIVKADIWHKKVFLVCLGGGTIGDLGGFIASIYKRGIPYIQIPTTLLSQIDASIGGKTAIDLKEAKNILGTFYQPKAVFIDPSFLDTLPVKELKEGIVEAIKYGIIKNRNFFYFLKEHRDAVMSLRQPIILKLISVCVRIKAQIVAEDEIERKGLRTILNFGHTFAHALETSAKYIKISHGEAVSLGMIYAAYLSCQLGICPRNVEKEIKETVKASSLFKKISFDYLTIYKAMSYDKKFTEAGVRMVLLKDIGKVKVIEGIKPAIMKKALKNFAAEKFCCGN